MNQIRQGDVFVTAASIPADVVKVIPNHRGYVLADGEATGHAHIIEASDAVEMYERDGVLYLKVEAPAPLTHQEHDTIVIAPGTYQVTRQREWSDENEPRQVAD